MGMSTSVNRDNESSLSGLLLPSASGQCHTAQTSPLSGRAQGTRASISRGTR